MFAQDSARDLSLFVAALLLFGIFMCLYGCWVGVYLRVGGGCLVVFLAGVWLHGG